MAGHGGDTLNLTIVSITNPDFQPDMESTSSYGWYHNALSASVEMRFNADPPWLVIEEKGDVVTRTGSAAQGETHGYRFGKGKVRSFPGKADGLFLCPGGHVARLR